MEVGRETLTAILARENSDHTIDFLAGAQDGRLEWRSQAVASIAKPPTVSPHIVALPNVIDVEVHHRGGYRAIAVMIEAGQATQFFVASTDENFRWAKAADVSLP